MHIFKQCPTDPADYQLPPSYFSSLTWNVCPKRKWLRVGAYSGLLFRWCVLTFFTGVCLSKGEIQNRRKEKESFWNGNYLLTIKNRENNQDRWPDLVKINLTIKNKLNICISEVSFCAKVWGTAAWQWRLLIVICWRFLSKLCAIYGGFTQLCIAALLFF